ncbi:unnamed protein product [Amoebophrya sp. A120]|nr:unnamed protein product [Amoebophrya sp. A120]|eukprot:GSA120T00009409001.1
MSGRTGTELSSSEADEDECESESVEQLEMPEALRQVPEKAVLVTESNFAYVQQLMRREDGFDFQALYDMSEKQLPLFNAKTFVSALKAERIPAVASASSEKASSSKKLSVQACATGTGLKLGDAMEIEQDNICRKNDLQMPLNTATGTSSTSRNRRHGGTSGDEEDKVQQVTTTDDNKKAESKESNTDDGLSAAERATLEHLLSPVIYCTCADDVLVRFHELHELREEVNRWEKELQETEDESMSFNLEMVEPISRTLQFFRRDRLQHKYSGGIFEYTGAIQRLAQEVEYLTKHVEDAYRRYLLRSFPARKQQAPFVQAEVVTMNGDRVWQLKEGACLDFCASLDVNRLKNQVGEDFAQVLLEKSSREELSERPYDCVAFNLHVHLQHWTRRFTEARLRSIFLKMCGNFVDKFGDTLSLAAVLIDSERDRCGSCVDIPGEAIRAFFSGILDDVDVKFPAAGGAQLSEFLSPTEELSYGSLPQDACAQDIGERGGGTVAAALLTSGLLRLWLVDLDTLRSAWVPRMLARTEDIEEKDARDLDRRCASASERQLARLHGEKIKTLDPEAPEWRTGKLPPLRTGDIFEVGGIRGAFGWRVIPWGENNRAILLNLSWNLKAGSLLVEGGRCVPPSQHPALRIYACVVLPNNGNFGASTSSSSTGRKGVAQARRDSIVGYLLLPAAAIQRHPDAELTLEEYKSFFFDEDGGMDVYDLGHKGVVTFAPDDSPLGMWIDPAEKMSGLDLLALRESRVMWTDGVQKSSIAMSSRHTKWLSEMIDQREAFAMKSISWLNSTYPELNRDFGLLRQLTRGCEYSLLSCAKKAIGDLLQKSYVRYTARKAKKAGRSPMFNRRPTLLTGEGTESGTDSEESEVGFDEDQAEAADEVEEVGPTTGKEDEEEQSAGAANGREEDADSDKNPWGEHQGRWNPRTVDIISRVSQKWRFCPVELIPGLETDLTTYTNVMEYVEKMKEKKRESSPAVSHCEGMDARERDAERSEKIHVQFSLVIAAEDEKDVPKYPAAEFCLGGMPDYPSSLQRGRLSYPNFLNDDDLNEIEFG